MEREKGIFKTYDSFTKFIFSQISTFLHFQSSLKMLLWQNELCEFDVRRNSNYTLKYLGNLRFINKSKKNNVIKTIISMG